MAERIITTAERRNRLAVRHRLLTSELTDDLPTITDDLVALHSSDPATVFLTAMVRMSNPSIGAVEDALYEQRSVVRHHAMRRTIWVMTPTVARLAHAAATDAIARAERKKNVKALNASDEIDDGEAWLDAAIAEIVELLENEGALGSRRIGAALPHLAIPLEYGSAKHSATLNAHTKVLQGAGFEGQLVRGRPAGTWLSSEYPWSPVEQWLDKPLAGADPAAAAAALVDRWLQRFGPATEVDVAWWFGWTKTLTRRALADAGAVGVALDDGAPAWVSVDDELLDAPTQVDPWVRLLPGLDPTTMGWKQRDWYLDPADVARLFDRFGNAGPTVWADGRVVGGWGQRPDGEIVLELTTSLDTTHKGLLDKAVQQLTDLLGDTVIKPRFPAPATRDLMRS